MLARTARLWVVTVANFALVGARVGVAAAHSIAVFAEARGDEPSFCCSKRIDGMRAVRRERRHRW